MNFYQWMTVGLLAFVVFSISDSIVKNITRFFAKKKSSDLHNTINEVND